MENALIHIDVEKEMFTANGKMKLSIQTTISDGNLVALFGPSGAGKTTLLRMLAGLTNPDRGEIRFGETVWYNSDKKINLPPQQRNVGYMFQDYALFPNLTVEENIAFAQPVKNLSLVKDLLSNFGLMELKNQKPHHLSGGQKQRVALARSIARKPQLMLLDEPLSALDAEMRNDLQNEIIRTHEMLGTTTLLVSHDLNEVFRLASHVLCIENGTILKTGTPNDVFCDNSISGKVQITGQIAHIEAQETIHIVTVISGNNQIIKVIAFDNDIEHLSVGDSVMVFTKAFNPIITRLNS